MKKSIVLIPTLIFVIIFSFGCSTFDPFVNRIQEVKTETSSLNKPIKITVDRKKNPFQVNAFFAINGDEISENNIEGHTKVNSKGYFEIDTVDAVGRNSYLFNETEGSNEYFFEGSNFIIENPNYEFGFEVDFAVTNSIALFGGVNYSEFNNKGFIGNNVGIGFFKENEDWSFRFDLGLDNQHSKSVANFVVHEQNFESGTREGIIYQVSRSKSYMDTYLGFTVNSKKDWLLNVFLNYSIGSKTFYDFEFTKNDLVFERHGNLSILNQIDVGEFSYSHIYNSFAFGFYHNVMDFGRIVFGGRYIKVNDDERDISSLNTFIQYNFLF